MLADSHTHQTLHRFGSLATNASQRAWAQVPNADALRSRAVRARKKVLDDLSVYLARFEEAAKVNGMRVHRAEGAQDANKLVIQILQSLHVSDAVRNHNPLLDEIQIDHAARINGLPLTALHPGDYLSHLLRTGSGHPVWPVAHLAVEDISTALQKKWRIPRIYNPDHLASTVRMPLRRTLLRTHAAILGVNFAVVQGGVCVMADNDGHTASLASLARHIVMLVSIDQLVADFDDLDVLLQVYALSAWGRQLPAYVTHLQRPAPVDVDGPHTLNLILVDNHRTEIMQQGFGEALRCINCGACHAACPVYQQISGAGYAQSPYTGPIGAVVNPILLRSDLGDSQAFLCSGSGHCRQSCPVDIDIPGLMLAHRRRLSKDRPQGGDKRFFSLWKRFLAHPKLFFPFIRRTFTL